MELRDLVILLGMITIALTAINIRLLSKYVYKLEDRIKALEEKLDAKLYICDEAQLCGALGAALFAYEKCSV